MTTFKAEYAINERVYIADLEVWCVVNAVLFTRTGAQYDVAYFHNGDRKSCYVTEAEIRREK